MLVTVVGQMRERVGIPIGYGKLTIHIPCETIGMNSPCVIYLILAQKRPTIHNDDH